VLDLFLKLQFSMESLSFPKISYVEDDNRPPAYRRLVHKQTVKNFIFFNVLIRSELLSKLPIKIEIGSDYLVILMFILTDNV